MNMDINPSTTPLSQAPAQIDWATASDQQILEADLLIALGLETLADEDKKAMIDRMTQTVQKAVALRVMNQLSDDQRNDLNNILSQQNDNQLEPFLRDHVPNFAELVEQETISFKRAMLIGKLPETAAAQPA